MSGNYKKLACGHAVAMQYNYRPTFGLANPSDAIYNCERNVTVPAQKPQTLYMTGDRIEDLFLLTSNGASATPLKIQGTKFT